MEEEIQSVMRLYDYSPNLVLYDNLLEISDEREKISEILEVGEQEALNPIEVVLESLLNIFSETISRDEVTHSENKALVNQDMRNRAIQRIIELVGNSKKKLVALHKMWLEELKTFLSQFYKAKKEIKIDEVIFVVSSKFRISSTSAIKAIISI